MSFVRGQLVRSATPLVAVVGATGTGKTRLGVELARAFPAEIVSADSMQVYQGLDIITAKPSAAERAGAPHHLLDILQPHHTFTVVDFRNRALRIIENLIENGKIPIVVGGTHYYVESILWKILVEDMDDSEFLMCERDELARKRRRLDDSKLTEATGEKLPITSELEPKGALDEVSIAAKETDSREEETKRIDKDRLRVELEREETLSNAEVHERLKAVDPAMAERLHPNNRRKVLRALEVWMRSGRRHSELLAEQADSERQLRNKDNTIVLWLKCEQGAHDARLDARVDGMLAAGLVREMLDYHARYNRGRLTHNQQPDYTKGIFQTLGFKEFHEYLVLSDAERDTDRGRKLLAEGLSNMKLGTRQFARRQNKMVRNRFLNHPTREIPPIYELDTTDLTKWDEEVKNKAIGIIQSFVNGVPCPHEPLTPSETARCKTSADIHSYNRCEVCDRIIIGDIQFRCHMASNKHKRMLARLKREREQSEAATETVPTNE